MNVGVPRVRPWEYRPGFSAEAEQVAAASTAGKRRLRESRMVGLGSAVFEELADVWEECRHPDWDGHGALPVTRETLQNTYSLLESLPLGTNAPTVGAEPDGQLTLEWHRGPRRTLSVSIGPEGELHYAALLGAGRHFGAEPFLGETPESILGLIQKVSR